MQPTAIRELGGILPDRPKAEAGISVGPAAADKASAALHLRKSRREKRTVFMQSSECKSVPKNAAVAGRRANTTPYARRVAPRDYSPFAASRSGIEVEKKPRFFD
jgi:hypothetical protein